MKDFVKMLDNVTQAINSMPQRVATMAVNFSKERFVEQNWHDRQTEPWKKRKGRRRGGDKRQNGAVLVDSGRLKRSIRVISASRERVVIGTDVPYAQAHNDGADGIVRVGQHNRRTRKGKKAVVRAHSRKMNLPQRQFIGESEELANRVNNMIVEELQKALER